MSTINVNEIEAASTGNLKITPNGTGVLEVTGDSPGMLKLNDTSGNGVKIKSPPASAGQSYTLILPTTNPVQDQFLRVDSITGSGSTAIGQLGYAAISPPSTSSLDASTITSGTMPSARYGLGSVGAGLALVQNTTLSSNVATIDFTSLDANSLYKLICKIGETQSNNGYVDLQFLNISGVPETGNITYTNFYNDQDYMAATLNTDYVRLFPGNQVQYFGFEVVFNTGDTGSTDHPKQPWLQGRLTDRTQSSSKCEIYASFTGQVTNKRIYGMRIKEGNGNSYMSGSVFMLYKYNEV